MTTHTLTIPHYHPTKLNALLGNWQAAARLKKQDREANRLRELNRQLAERLCRVAERAEVQRKYPNLPRAGPGGDMAPIDSQE